MGGQINVPSLGAEMGEIGDGGFGSRDQDQIGVAGQGAACLNNLNTDLWRGRKRVKIVEIRNTVQARHSDFDWPALSAGDIHHILCR